MLISSTHHKIRSAADAEYIKEIMTSSTGLSGNAEIIKQYEDKLQATFNVEHAIAVSSGTSAIYAALVALNVTKGDEVILPVTAAVMTGLPILALGATPVFVDCAKDSFAICCKSLQHKISPKTKAIISVPMWGYPAFSTELKQYAESVEVPIIEDAAQAIGTVNNNHFEGTQGVIGCFSTHEIKMISTGEGGFIVTNDSKIASSLRSFSRLGVDKQSRTPQNFGSLSGLNFKLNALSSALGCREVDKLPHTINTRQIKAAQWAQALDSHAEMLDDVSYDQTTQQPNGYSCIKLFNSQMNSTKNLLAQNLKQEAIETDFVRYNYKLLPEYPIFAPHYQSTKYPDMSSEFPNACMLLQRLLILPTHEGITEENIIIAAKIIKQQMEILSSGEQQ